MENKKTGFAIIGTGAIAHIHAQAIASIESANLLSVYSRTKEKAVDFAQQYSCKVFDSLEALLQDNDLDIVCICTPSGAHLQPALLALEAGKHCLIEKPLEVNLEKTDLIIQKAEEKGLKLGVIFPSRFYPVSQLLKDAVDANRFGKMVLASVYVKWSRTEAYYASARWRGTREWDGGGALMNQGIHSVDMLQWYMGPVESVHAWTANIRHKGIEVEDTLVANVKFKNGALGTIECTTAGYPGSLKRLELVGTAGTVVLEESNLLTWQFEDAQDEDEGILADYSGKEVKGGVADPMDINYFGHQRQIIDFMDAIRADKKPMIDGPEGRKSVEIIRAIYESAASGQVVNL